MYEDKKQLALEKVEKKEIFILSIKICFSGDLDLKQQQSLPTIADKCPIHKIPIITTEI
jgi:hypothetical protein